jgi:phosphoribosylformimino-5-aminoimidazole carboxamide ribotide isomerase
MITIIPAIDIIGGQCVRLSQGDFNQQTKYHDDPLEVARSFEAAGLERLHLVDLDGAKNGKVINQAVLEKIVRETKLKVDFSGGIKTREEIAQILATGASWVSIGSMAAKDPATFLSWLNEFGPDKLMLGADVKGEQIVIRGWQEQTTWNVFDFIGQYYTRGLRQVFCTDITLDGMLQGPAVALYRKIMDRFPDLCLIASGGVASLEDIDKLEQAGCKAVITGKAIYEGRISLEELALRNRISN